MKKILVTTFLLLAITTVQVEKCETAKVQTVKGIVQWDTYDCE